MIVETVSKTIQDCPVGAAVGMPIDLSSKSTLWREVHVYNMIAVCSHV